MLTLVTRGQERQSTYHVFEQDRIPSYETETEGYNMLNLGLAYNGQYMQGNDYRVYFKTNNLLQMRRFIGHTSFLSTIPQVGRNFTFGLDFMF